jgi:hypothetical protein
MRLYFVSKYLFERFLYDFEVNAKRVTISPINHVMLKTRAIARSGVFPYHPENISTQVELAINGITKISVIGPIKKAVRGDADCSTLCAKPKTLPCLSNGTTF